MKEETKVHPLLTLSMMYSYIKKNNEGDKKAKGINKESVKIMMQEEYKNTILKRNK